MNNFKKIIIGILILFFINPLLAQVSLWRDHNPYADNIKTGDIINIIVIEKFNIVNEGEWKNTGSWELKLTPDLTNMPFLSASEENKTRNLKENANINISENIEFEITGIVGQKLANGINFVITAQKNINIDNKTSKFVLSGIINPNSIQNGSINSKKIANLELVVTTKPLPPLDNSIELTKKSDNKEDDAEKKEKEPENQISTEKQRELILKQMQEILGVITK
ncbi:MAG: flagellar basal body L-ring protein FlgH [Spirochaetia bacterium]|nr:flagellar basal body L-ring protein FlgH [Spirochaetia bacterium]